MPKLIICRGLPASGKTTRAVAWVGEDPEHRARVNRDQLRLMLHNGVWKGHDTERQVRAARDSAISALLRLGMDVVCDDTNLPQKGARELVEVAQKAGAGVEVWDMTDVPVEVCKERDAARGAASVGPSVISNFHKRYLKGVAYPLPLPYPEAKPEAVEYVAKEGTPKTVMVDLDGTLCLHNGRSPYDETRVGEDMPNRAVVEAARAFYHAGYNLVFCSGRTDTCSAASMSWIDQHVGIDDYDLYMRTAGDVRNDAVVKRELFDEHIRDVYDVVAVLDDRQRVVDMWRDLGLSVFQVAPGNF